MTSFSPKENSPRLGTIDSRPMVKYAIRNADLRYTYPFHYGNDSFITRIFYSFKDLNHRIVVTMRIILVHDLVHDLVTWKRALEKLTFFARWLSFIGGLVIYKGTYII